jgi:ribonuclease J
VHGHGSQEDLKLVINLTKPKYFIPIHGDYRMLTAHQELAVACSVPPLNALIIENGDVLEVGNRSARIVDKIDLEPGLIGNRPY